MNTFPKHLQGYLPKIQYWAGQLQEAAYLNEPGRIPYIWVKLQYFMDRQAAISRKDIPGFEGTSSQLDNLTIYK
jgi:hypothetical protein